MCMQFIWHRKATGVWELHWRQENCLFRFLPALLYTRIVRNLSQSQLGSIVIIFIFCSFGPVAVNRKQVRKCNPKVTLRRVHATFVTVEKQQVLFILSVLVNLFIQQAIRMRRIVIRGLSWSSFSHKLRDFGKNINEHEMCVLRLYINFVWNIFYSKQNLGRYDLKCTFIFTWSTSYSCHILI